MKKAQDSLMSDLESCVTKRDNIIDKNIAKEKNKKSTAKVEKSLSTKIRNLQSKITKIEKVTIVIFIIHLLLSDNLFDSIHAQYLGIKMSSRRVWSVGKRKNDIGRTGEEYRIGNRTAWAFKSRNW